MPIELDPNAAAGGDGVAADGANYGADPGAIIDPATMQMFTSPSLRDLAEGEHTPGTPPVVDPSKPDAATKDRYEYWQSQADKERNARLALEQELAVARPVIRAIQSDDELYRTVTQRLDGAQPAKPAIKPPAPPARPDSYSDQEAYTNPQSESFKFRAANEKYMRDRMDYLEALNRQTAEQTQQREAQLAEQSERSRILSETERTVQTQYGLQPADAREFVAWASDDKSVTLPSLVSFYRYLKAGGKIPGNGNVSPAPPTRGGGAPPVVNDADKAWNDAMFGARKR